MSANAVANLLVRVVFGVERASEIVKLVPGVALAAAVMFVALPLADLVGRWVLSLQGIDPTGKASPVSGVLMAIVIGMLLRNTIALPEWIKPGIHFSVTKILRLGIILVGIKLSLVDVLKLGGYGIPIVLGVIASGLVFVNWFNRLLRLPERLGTLIAAGTGICGVTAIVSTAPAIDAEDREVAYAVTNVTLFGLVGMFLYPYVAPLLLQTSEQVGLFLGTAVHETSQVVGAALTYKEVFNDDTAFKAAVVTKLTRNLFLIAVVPALALYYLRHNQKGGSHNARVSLTKLFPMFVIGFIAMAVLRSLGDAGVQHGAAFGLFEASTWNALTKSIGEVWGSQYLLGTAMAAVGLGTNFSVFKSVGLKPFAVGFVGALLVGVVGLGLALTLGPYVHL